jgi:hypothetical protein
MYKVTYSYYGKNPDEKSFNTYSAAKAFFYAMLRNNSVTNAELVTP